MERPTERKCKRCGKVKPLTRGFFSLNSNCKYGFNPRCKTCVSEVTKLKRESRPGYTPLHRLSEVDPKTREARCSVCGPAEVNRRGDSWVCKTKQREFYEASARRRGVQVGRNKDYHYLSDIDEVSRTGICRQCGSVDLYRAPHKSGSGWQCGNKYRESRKTNRERDKKYQQEWASKNREAVRVSKRRYKARRNEWVSFDMTERDRLLSLEYRKVLSRDPCFYCGTTEPRKLFHIDHYVPLSRGGTDHWWNLVQSCDECNLRKKEKDPLKFLVEMGKVYCTTREKGADE